MRGSPLIPIFLTVFIDLVGFGIIIPALPFYVRSFGADAGTLGLLTATFSLMQFLFMPILGDLSDRLGRRPVIIFSLIGTAVSALLMGVANTWGGLALLFVARALSGISGATISTAQAYIADVTTPEKRAAGMGLIGVAFGLGFILGPTFGGILSHRFGVTVPFLFVAVLALANAGLAWWMLPEPERRQAPTTKGSRLLAIKEALSRGETAIPIHLFSLTILAFTNLETTLALLTLDRYGLTSEQTGYLFAYMGVMITVVQGGLIRRLVPLLGEQRLVWMGTASTGLAMLLIGVRGELPFLILALGGVALGQGVLNPSLSSILSRQAPEGKQGLILGVSQSLGSLARVVGPIMGGFLYSRVGMAAPYVAGGFLMLCASAMGVYYQGKYPVDTVVPPAAPDA